MKAMLIINPKAGRRKNSPVTEIKDTIAEQPTVELIVHETTGPGDATQAARRASSEGFDLVIAAGGDGSVNEVANGLVGTQTALGIVPVGTENVLAREMGIPLSPKGACQFMLETPPRHIDTGRIENRHFVCFAGIGFDAHVAHRLLPERKKSLGALAYFLTSFEKIGPYRKLERVAHLTVDGEAHELSYWMILVGNIRNYGGGMVPAPRARLDDGLLDMCVFPKVNLPQTVRQMASTRGGKHLDLPGVKYFQARKFELRTEPPEQIQLDGDPWSGVTPTTIEVEPGSLIARF